MSLTSRAIASVAYDTVKERLEVELRSGEVHAMDAVPPVVYHNLISSESPGTYYYLHIRKGAYPSTRLR